MPYEANTTLFHTGGATLLLLHEGKPEDTVKSFFTEIHDLYTKQLMNPFSGVDTAIT